MTSRSALVLALIVTACSSTSALAQTTNASYALVNGCYGLRSQVSGMFVAKDGTGGYRASAPSAGAGEGFRMQATKLGSYLLYGRAADFLGSGGSVLGASTAPAVVTSPSEATDWRVDSEGNAFRLTLPDGNSLAASADGSMHLVSSASASAAGLFEFVASQGCPSYPEIEVNASGPPLANPLPYGEVRGLLDGHMHGMAFEFLGGDAHCGRPWSPYGAPVALTCPDAVRSTGSTVLEYGVGTSSPDPHGWPTFTAWPAHDALTHEQSYYKWIERAWRGGLRTFVNLLVENHALCSAYPIKHNSCNEMDSVRLQAKDIYAMQDYIDAQAGGPGKGFFRIVTDPFQARRTMNAGKLAVVLGIEVSQLFNCGLRGDVPTCSSQDIDRGLDEVYKLGVRDMELINKFDNAFGGVAGDSGTTGTITGTGNFLETGRFFQMQTCTGPANDRPQETLPGIGRDPVIANGLASLLPPGLAPIYPPEPHCNVRALTTLGEHILRGMMARHMIIDPDHLDVISRSELLSTLEAAHYSGVISSHSWSDNESLPRIYRLGGVVTPYAGNATSFVKAWQQTRAMANPRYFFGFGYGADMNGFGAQGGPRNGPNPVTYPIKSFDGSVTLDRQRSGTRTYDINQDGVAHYGMFPDWIADLRNIAGDQIVTDMSRGPEAYLQMWERANGVPLEHCRTAHLRLTSAGMGQLRLGDTPEQALMHAGQVRDRRTRAWSYCILGHENVGARSVSVFDTTGRVGLIATTGPQDFARGIRPGLTAPRVSSRVRRIAPGLLSLDAGGGARFIYGVRGGRVHFVAVASPAVASSRTSLQSMLRIATLG